MNTPNNLSTKNAFVSLKVAAEDKNNDHVSKVTSFAVDPRALEINEGFNPRPLNPKHMAEMSLAMRNGATFPPLDVWVEEGHIFIVDGHHRHAAALDAIGKGVDIKSLECRHFRGNDADRVAHSLNSAGGLALTPLQLGLRYQTLIGFGWTEQRIADRRGKSLQHVKDMIQLAEANSDVHQAVDAGEISGTAALKMVKQHGSRAGAVIREGVEQAKAHGKGKVKPKALAGTAKVTDKQMLAWLVANSAMTAYPGAQPPGVAQGFAIIFEVPATAEHSNDLLSVLAAAATHSTTT